MIPAWVPSLLVPLAEFLFISLPAMVKGTPPPPPPDGRKPGFAGIDAKVDADRAKQRAEMERTQPTITPLTSTTTTAVITTPPTKS